MKNVVHAVHGVLHRLNVPDIADEEFDFVGGFRQLCLKLMAHIVLLFLVPGKNADLADIRIQEPVQHRVAEGAGAAGDHQSFVRENAHILLS